MCERPTDPFGDTVWESEKLGVYRLIIRVHKLHFEGLGVDVSKRDDQMCKAGGVDVVWEDLVAIACARVPWLR